MSTVKQQMRDIALANGCGLSRLKGDPGTIDIAKAMAGRIYLLEQGQYKLKVIIADKITDLRDCRLANFKNGEAAGLKRGQARKRLLLLETALLGWVVGMLTWMYVCQVAGL